jgi:membrane associated rhomboid family serine protease
MSYYEKNYRERQKIGYSGDPLTLLIVINLTVFIGFMLIKVMYYFGQSPMTTYYTEILDWFTLPASLDKLISRPWTIISHMFLHDRVWHVFGNMIWLWVFGYILKDLIGDKKIVPIYIYGGLAGALAYVLAFNTFSVFSGTLPVATALGASAAVMGIAVATTTVAPNYRIFPMLNGGIPLWVITVLFLVIDLATIPNDNAGGHIAHLAGALSGYVFIILLHKGYDGSVWMNNFFDWINNMFNPNKPKKAKVVKGNFFENKKKAPFIKKPKLTQQRVDELLDKISQKGYDSLTQEEKDFLEKASKEEL